jgi:hypothetical protein
MKGKTLWAAFYGTGSTLIPALGVWAWTRREIDVLISDRVANDEAFRGERAMHISVGDYLHAVADISPGSAKSMEHMLEVRR